jgi:hypothetical protein
MKSETISEYPMATAREEFLTVLSHKLIMGGIMAGIA